MIFFIVSKGTPSFLWNNIIQPKLPKKAHGNLYAVLNTAHLSVSLLHGLAIHFLVKRIFFQAYSINIHWWFDYEYFPYWHDKYNTSSN